MALTQTGDHAHINIGTNNDIGRDQINYNAGRDLIIYPSMLYFLLGCLALTICTSASNRYRRTAESCIRSCLRLRPSSKFKML